MSMTLEANFLAGSSSRVSASIIGYSLSPEPQPAALVTTASISSGKALRFRRACLRAREPSPICHARAPQHPCFSGIITSMPLLVRMSMVARLIAGARTCWAHPLSRAIRPVCLHPVTARVWGLQPNWIAILSHSRPYQPVYTVFRRTGRQQSLCVRCAHFLKQVTDLPKSYSVVSVSLRRSIIKTL